MAIQDAIFRRSELLLGNERMGHIAQKRVIIFGVGGVGSWCAESLVRSGIRQLTIVDSDRVCITNINRQLMATTKTIGQVKVEALKERLLTINPAAEITAMQKIFTAENAADFELDTYDYIIDAIDSLKDKAALILLACQTEAKFYSSMGAALKLDPTRIKVTEFWKVQGDPLAGASLPPRPSFSLPPRGIRGVLPRRKRAGRANRSWYSGGTRFRRKRFPVARRHRTKETTQPRKRQHTRHTHHT